jgi:hypothetical protein
LIGYINALTKDEFMKKQEMRLLWKKGLERIIGTDEYMMRFGKRVLEKGKDQKSKQNVLRAGGKR